MDKKSDSRSTHAPIKKRMIGDQVFEGSKFKLVQALRKRNDSYQKYMPEIVMEPHGHTYYTINNKTGVPNIYSAPMGSHFHEMKLDYTGLNDETDVPRIQCGPPLKYVTYKSRAGTVTKKIVPIQWPLEEDGKYVSDEHTHDVVYEGSLKTSPTQIRQMLEDDRAKVSHLLRGQAPRNTPAPTNVADTGGAQITEV